MHCQRDNFYMEVDNLYKIFLTQILQLTFKIRKFK